MISKTNIKVDVTISNKDSGVILFPFTFILENISSEFLSCSKIVKLLYKFINDNVLSYDYSSIANFKEVFQDIINNEESFLKNQDIIEVKYIVTINIFEFLNNAYIFLFNFIDIILLEFNLSRHSNVINFLKDIFDCFLLNRSSENNISIFQQYYIEQQEVKENNKLLRLH